MPSHSSPNPLLSLPDQAAFARLGPEFYQEVRAAEFPRHVLRFRHDDLVRQLGLDPDQVTDAHFIEAFGRFRGGRPQLAMAYHGYQFGEYNPYLGDGRGFLYGQFQGADGQLYDLGTKGSGTTPYSRGGDGRLTLKGGVREILAGEVLHRLGVTTSRCLSLIETGEKLWRGDEPSPTRSAVMVRLSRSHIRFGTFERLAYLQRPDLIRRLLDHVIELYYPDQLDCPEPYIGFFHQLVSRVADLAAQWMAAGFCHGVLNTDNMSILGESFDYGPYGFIETYNPRFIAAYFDYWGYYCFGNQPEICRLNLERLIKALAAVIPQGEMYAALEQFPPKYQSSYHQRLLQKLGLDPQSVQQPKALLDLTLRFLQISQVSYSHFFATLPQYFSAAGRLDPEGLATAWGTLQPESWPCLQQWLASYQDHLDQLSPEQRQLVPQQLRQHTPVALPRSVIEAVWQSINDEDHWHPFDRLLAQIRSGDSEAVIS